MRDNIFARPIKVEDFSFNQQVATVFSDMIKRSVPGYIDLIQNIGIIASNFVDETSIIYDLGCSLGEVSNFISLYVPKSCRILAVDNSCSMLEECKKHLTSSNIELIYADITNMQFEPSRFAVLNLTLQFIAPDKRLDLLSKIYQSLLPNSALIISEKFKFTDEFEQNFMDKLHINFKRAQGYSELEIAQKRSAIENVLISDTEQTHVKRLHQAGFSKVITWFRCLNFASIIALK